MNNEGPTDKIKIAPPSFDAREAWLVEEPEERSVSGFHIILEEEAHQQVCYIG